MRSKVLFVPLVLAALAASAFVFLQDDASAAPPIQPQSVNLDRGEALYAENCASCHGANLEGQDNWQSQGGSETPPAPPHDETGHTWHHGDALLFTYTKRLARERVANTIPPMQKNTIATTNTTVHLTSSGRTSSTQPVRRLPIIPGIVAKVFEIPISTEA